MGNQNLSFIFISIMKATWVFIMICISICMSYAYTSQTRKISYNSYQMRRAIALPPSSWPAKLANAIHQVTLKGKKASKALIAKAKAAIDAAKKAKVGGKII